MQSRSAVIRLRLDFFKPVIHFVRKNPVTSAFCFVFLAGCILGAVFSSVGVFDEGYLDDTFSVFIESRRLSGFTGLFSSIFTPSLIFLILAFLCGFFVFGSAVAPVLIFVRGLGFGFCVGRIITSYGINGTLFWFFVILPGLFFSSAALIASCKASFDISLELLYQLKADMPQMRFRARLQPFFKCFLIMTAVTVFSSALEAALNLLVMPLINV